MIKLQQLYILYAFIGLVIIFAIIMAIVGSSDIRWIIPSIGLALVSAGLGFTSFTIALHANSTANSMHSLLEQIKQTQEDTYTELKEQKGSGTHIVASLEAMSKYYTDYIAKQRSDDEKQQQGGNK